VRVLICGGGTGGHLFPAVALAETFRTRDADNEIRFVTTSRVLDEQVLKDKGFSAQSLEMGGLKGKGMGDKMRSLSRLPKAFLASLGILREFRPHLVVGVGGYVTGPVVLAAWMKGIPSAIQEQNAIPGITNRLLGRFVDAVFCAFEESRGYFPMKKCRLTGNPIRAELQTASGGRPGLKRPLTILVLGGSQGARRINQILVEALEEIGSLREEFFFIHQTGSKDHSWVARAYEQKGFAHQVKAFISNMALAYGQADMIVSRAGAMTVSEITALGKPSCLVPFPFAANNHQEHNALALVRAGAAEMILEKDLTPGELGKRLRDWLAHPERLAVLAERARALGRWGAAEEIVEHCYRLVSGKGPGPSTGGLNPVSKG
jgi:UDP-N-acetylglucosamine--N-acetylmuramyl-(pentapeptide) pyrophosphoryl-undecaprenol N-acetylglucosamine transferase